MLITAGKGHNLKKREFDEPLPNPSPTRRGAEIFLVLTEKIKVSKPLSPLGDSGPPLGIGGKRNGSGVLYIRRTHVKKAGKAYTLPTFQFLTMLLKYLLLSL